MPTKLRYTKYTFNDHDSEEHFSVDFSQPLDVRERHLDLVAADLSSFEIESRLVGKKFNSILELDIDGSTLKLARNYVTDSVTFEPSGTESAVGWINSKLNTKLTSQDFSRFTLKYTDNEDFVKTQIKSLLQSSDDIKKQMSSPADIESQLKELLGEEVLEDIENLKKLKALQEKLEIQKKADEAQLRSSEIEKQIDQINSATKIVDELIGKQKQIEMKLNQFGELLKVNLEAEGKRLKQEIETIRRSRLSRFADKLFSREKEFVRRMVEVSMVSKLIPVASGVVFVIGLIGAVLTAKWYLALMGLAFGVTSFMLWFNALTSPRDYHILGDNGGELEFSETSLSKNNEHSVLENNNKKVAEIEKFFVQKAWITGLKKEHARISGQIKDSLDGKDYGEIKKRLKSLMAEHVELKQIVKENEENEISPEDYFKLRREEEMLKGHKARLEAKIKRRDDYLDLQEMIDTMTLPESQDRSQGLDLNLITGFDKIRVKGEVVELHNEELKQWQQVDLEPSQIYGIYVMLKLMEWEVHSSVPMVLINILHELQNSVKDHINAKINELADKGQIIIVNLAL